MAGLDRVKNYVHNTHMDPILHQLHEALLDLVGILNEPQRDAAMIAEAGIALDRALFPLLVRIERRGPIGVVELADISGRDHTTVSRQVGKLEELGLVTRQTAKHDKRAREVFVTRKGLAMTKALDAARERRAAPALRGWSTKDKQTLARLLTRLVSDAKANS